MEAFIKLADPRRRQYKSKVLHLNLTNTRNVTVIEIQHIFSKPYQTHRTYNKTEIYKIQTSRLIFKKM